MSVQLRGRRRGAPRFFGVDCQAIRICDLDVINAVDPIDRIESCPLCIQLHGLNLCPLHKRLSEATAHVEAAFSQSRLSELIEESQSPLCKSVPLTAG